jgi:hypothetical protein
VIVSLHVATGAVAGALAGSRVRALVVGPALHLAADVTPHHDFVTKRFEAWTGFAALGFVAATRGPFSAETVGAAAAAAPDLEHVLHVPRPRGRAMFPSHRVPFLHRTGGISARGQLLVAAALLALLATGVPPPRSRRASAGRAAS